MTRVLSAIVLIALVVGVVWFAGSWAVLLLAMAAAALAGMELARLATAAGSPISPVHTAVAASVVCLAASDPLHFALYASPRTGLSGDTAVTLLLIAGAVLLALTSRVPHTSLFGRVGLAFFAPMYVGLPLGLLAHLHARGGRGVVSWFLIVLATSDTGQYYSGRLLGRHKLAPVISPAKTIEGAVGGLIAAAVVGALLVATPVDPFPGATREAGIGGHSRLIAGAAAVILAAVGIAGDLFESMLKRSAGAKDSAALIPGHGGVLDRIDSYLLAAPVYFVLFILASPGLGTL